VPVDPDDGTRNVTWRDEASRPLAPNVSAL
jgi:hypothetical protein